MSRYCAAGHDLSAYAYVRPSSGKVECAVCRSEWKRKRKQRLKRERAEAFYAVAGEGAECPNGHPLIYGPAYLAQGEVVCSVCLREAKQKRESEKPKRKRRERPHCVIDGCHRVAGNVKDGLCRDHYDERTKPPCGEPGCQKPARGTEMPQGWRCLRHRYGQCTVCGSWAKGPARDGLPLLCQIHLDERTKPLCEEPECQRNAVGRATVRGWRCSLHRRGRCSADDCDEWASRYRDGVPVCRKHKFGKCQGPGCTAWAGQVVNGIPLCNPCKHGTCSVEDCSSGGNAWRNGLPVCKSHQYGECDVDWCSSWANGPDGLCRGHQQFGRQWKADKTTIRHDHDDVYLYVVHHPEFEAIKIGIGRSTARLIRHRAHGWQIITVTEPTWIGQRAMAIEVAVCSAWRAAGLPIGVLPENMPQNGATETAPGSLLDARALARWVDAGADGAPPLPGLALGAAVVAPS